MQSNIEWDKLLPSLLTLGGVLIGGVMALAGNLLVKRQERRGQLHKLIGEKRLNAYEEIMVAARMVVYAAGKIEDGKIERSPVILRDIEAFDAWFRNLVSIYMRVSHLVDKSTAARLMRLQNYLHNFEYSVLARLRGADGKVADTALVEKVGVIVCYDFFKLGSDIVEAASRFYSSDIYNDEFVPSIVDREERKAAKDIFDLALFRRESEINDILTHAKE